MLASLSFSMLLAGKVKSWEEPGGEVINFIIMQADLQQKDTQLKHHNNIIQQLTAQLREKDDRLRQREEELQIQLQQRDEELQHRDADISRLQREVQMLQVPIQFIDPNKCSFLYT